MHAHEYRVRYGSVCNAFTFTFTLKKTFSCRFICVLFCQGDFSNHTIESKTTCQKKQTNEHRNQSKYAFKT